jgi:endonuclease YncB( thermonuclease family)
MPYLFALLQNVMATGPRLVRLVLMLALLMAMSSHATLAEMAGEPKVIDGDTLEVAGAVIRLRGIDAPELGQTCRIGERAYDCGEIARTALLDLTAGVAVTCEPAPAGAGYGAEDSVADGRIGRCTADGYDLSEGMAYTGRALALRRVSERYVAFEDRARAARRGLWKGEFIAPWDWRAGARLPQAGAE